MVSDAIRGRPNLRTLTLLLPSLVELPALHPAYGNLISSQCKNQTYLPAAIPTVPNGGNHTALFAKAARTEEAHNATISVTKGLAVTGLRAIDDDAFYQHVYI